MKAVEGKICETIDARRNRIDHDRAHVVSGWINDTTREEIAIVMYERLIDEIGRIEDFIKCTYK